MRLKCSLANVKHNPVCLWSLLRVWNQAQAPASLAEPAAQWIHLRCMFLREQMSLFVLLCVMIHCLCTGFEFRHVSRCIWVSKCVTTCLRVPLDLYINQSGFNALGWALASHYTGSITNRTFSVPVSTNLSLLSPFVRDLSLSFSQTAPPPYLPTACCNHSLLSHALMSVFLLFFPLSYLSHASVLPPPVSFRSLRSPPCWLHIVSFFAPLHS